MCWLAMSIMLIQRVPLVSALLAAQGRAHVAKLAHVVKFAVPIGVFSGSTHAVSGATTEVKPWDGGTATYTNPTITTIGEDFEWFFFTEDHKARSLAL